MDGPARALASAIDDAIAGWVVRSVDRRLQQQRQERDAVILGQASEAGRRAAADVGARIRRLLATDIDEQWTTPLSILREAVRYPTEVLRSAGLAPVHRDPFAVERFPDDDYDLTPATFADIDPALHEVGLAWGAAKAAEHRRRHMHVTFGVGSAPPERSDRSGRKIVAFVPDLMDRSKITAAAPEVVLVAEPAALAQHEADIVIVDLSRPGVLEVLRGLRAPRIIGFGSHIDGDRLEQARQSGCTEVLPRSRFFARVQELLR